jgi:hypothetical protein
MGENQMIEFPVRYKNGNYGVTIFKDGTKTRFTKEDEFIPERPETLDINISNYCENNCPWCYLDASPDGKHGNLDLDFFDSIEPGTEIAINYTDHPSLNSFLLRMRNQGVITNITVNQLDLEKKFIFFLDWQLDKLIHGVGISIISNEIYPWVTELENRVAHTIWGITPYPLYKKISQYFDKVLILGYKNKGRGKAYEGYKNTPKIEDISKLFNIVSFDNLAINQIGMQQYINKKDWDIRFMGKEGEFSFYIDTVTEKFFKSSSERVGHNFNGKTVKEMFYEIRSQAGLVRDQ